MRTQVPTLARSSAAHVLVAFAAMGGWAVFANRMHAMPAPLLAGLVQGAISGTITYFLKRTVEALSARFEGMGRLLLPPAIAFATSLAVLVTLHTLSGTPEILRTIALPLAISTGYAALYSHALWRRERT
ncbi:hypothetical protein [Aquibium oceanicum]|uniref:Transmembrane protein n=1 Tax=Aquibium oceanicum TaxID=1670800 RepID=A0A1L3SNL1_9HYPH|nr:hypothetical protein [Aquibium oceanicum]APH70988.1 hypothetical protein BSQ44_06065 [Aquibium oceanicum]